jgi:hypothetical protein
MRQVTIILNTTGNAFKDDADREVRRVLEQLTFNPITDREVYDLEGNVIGEVIIRD